VLSLLLIHQYDPVLTVLTATAGNVLGAVTNYLLGYYGRNIFEKKWFRISKQEFQKALVRYRKFGTISLLLAWVPVIGDSLTVAAGSSKINPIVFLVLVTAGKAARYVVISLSVLAV